jgi:hypothetical protein
MLKKPETIAPAHSDKAFWQPETGRDSVFFSRRLIYKLCMPYLYDETVADKGAWCNSQIQRWG